MRHKIAIALIIAGFALYFASPWAGVACFLLGFAAETLGFLFYVEADRKQGKSEHAQSEDDRPPRKTAV